MKKGIFVTLLVFLNIVMGGSIDAESKEQTMIPGPIEVVRVDVHERLYPDRWPKPAGTDIISIPRGTAVTFQFAVRANEKGLAKLSITGDLAGKSLIHWLQSVHVEGNTQGSLINRPGGKVPKGWLEHHLLRPAPFDTLEVLVEGKEMGMLPDRTHGVVVEISVPKDAEPGTYKGALHVKLGNEEATIPLSYRVHKTLLPDRLPLHSTHWLQARPGNLTNGEVPEWWSEKHWQLLERAGKQLRRFGDDTVYTPLINLEEPLIQVRRSEDGNYAFDYSRFDRWAGLFFGLGFEYIAGNHVHYMFNKNAGYTYCYDEKTGKKEVLFKDKADQDKRLELLKVFYDSFHEHLKKKGWLKKYVHHQYDEPSDAKLYKQYTDLARKHLSGVKTIDALNNSATRFTPMVDIAVFSLLQLNRHQRTAIKRNAEGKGVWLYHCTSPYPPNPNRHIDSHLTESRLYPWLAYKLGAKGFLFWAANHYRGADEYKTSIGPFPAPKNNQDPGHPPGDNWFYYRSPEGLRPSIRIVSHREGLIDHALLTLLAKHDPGLVKKLVKEIAPSISKFECDPIKYHQVRTTILEALDKR